LLQYDEADEKKRAQAEKLQKLELAELVKASRAQANKKGKGLLLVFFQSAFVHSERIEPHICVEQMQHQRTMTHLSREWRPPL
jgi:hypothetical protein